MGLVRRARSRRVAAALVVACLSALAVPLSAQTSELPEARDADAIRAILRDQYDALLALDATRYASHLREDAVWENALGDRHVGRDSIRAFNARVAATMQGARYDEWSARVSFLDQDVAVADVVTTLRGQNIAGRRLVDRPMLNVYVLRRDTDRWRIAHTRIRDQWVVRYADEVRDSLR